MKVRPPTKLKPGDELTSGWLNWLLSWVTRNTIEIGVNSGLSMVQTDHGTALRTTGQPTGAQLAITDGDVSERSGTTPGTGTVFRVAYDGTVLVTDTVDLDVFNFSSTTGGIPDSTYCWIEQDPQGNWWITSVDCGN